MTKDSLVRSIEKCLSTQEMMLLRIKNGIYDNRAKNLDQMMQPFEHANEFLNDPENRLREFLGDLIFDNLTAHSKNEEIKARQIYDIFFKEKSGFFGSKIQFVEPSQIDIEKAKANYQDLAKINEKIVENIKSGLQRIQSLGIENFEE